MNSASKNLCGGNIARLRAQQSPELTQEALAAKVQRQGVELDRVAIAKIETQKRRIYDFEVVAIAKSLKVSPLTLLGCE
jgi:hypothetical protein